MTRENRSITIDFGSDTEYYRIVQKRKEFLNFCVEFLKKSGLTLKHKPGCPGGFSLTLHSHYKRSKLKGTTIYRVQCTKCKAVFTVLPHFVSRYG